MKVPKISAIQNVSLTGYTDIFKSTVDNPNGESIILVQLDELHTPQDHPFQVKQDEAMERLVKNIKEYGVLVPGLVRTRSGGGYEVISGNRRKLACKLAGLATMPVIIKEMDNESAIIIMVDCNLEQRETLLFSEKALAYKAKMQALCHKGVKDEKQSVETLMEQTGESRSQIFRLLRLTELIVDLLDKVDTKQLAFNPAVELSHLSISEQKAVVLAMEKYSVKPSVSQAIRLKKLNQAKKLTDDMIDEILSEIKGAGATKEDKVISPYRNFFPESYTASQIHEVITNLLQKWQLGQTQET